MVNTTVEMRTLDDPVFYVYLVSQILVAFALPSQLILLYQIWKHQLAADLSANLIINIVSWCMFLSNGVILGMLFDVVLRSVLSGSYMMITLESTEKNGYYVFFAGAFHVALGQNVGVSLTFLCLDRIVALLFPMRYVFQCDYCNWWNPQLQLPPKSICHNNNPGLCPLVFD